MTTHDLRLVLARCLAASATCEALIPDSGVAPASARAMARAYRFRAKRLEAWS